MKFTKNGKRIGRPETKQSIVQTLIEQYRKNPSDRTETVRKLILMAHGGNLEAIKLIASYLDGKPVETRRLEKEERVTIIFKPAKELGFAPALIEGEFTEIKDPEKLKASVS